MGLSLSGLKSSALSGFKKERLMKAGFAIGGAVATNYLAGMALKAAASFLPSDTTAIGKAAKVGVTLLTAGAVGVAARKVIPGRANAVLTGGVISGVVTGIHEFFPSVGGLNMSGLQDEWTGGWNLGDFASPREATHAFSARQPYDVKAYRLNGMGDWASPRDVSNATNVRQPIVTGAMPHPAMRHAMPHRAMPGHHGMGDMMTVRKVDNAFPARQPIGNYADAMVGEHIGEQIDMM